MFNFDYYNPTRIVFGKSRLAELDHLIPKQAKVIVLYGGNSAVRFGILDKVLNGLGDRKYTEFSGIEPNPKFETAMQAVEIARNEEIDFILAVGGGSVIDAAKFVSLATKYTHEPPENILSKVFIPADRSELIPFGTVVTIPASGSEMNAGGVITYNQGKYFFTNPFLFPGFSFLDPTLTYSLPDTLVANGIVDSFVHVMEQYLTYPVDARFQDRTAEGILQTLIEIGLQTIENPTDFDARSNLFVCATMAFNGLISSGVPQDWATHMIGHELTALFGIDHAKSLAIVYPRMMRVRKEQKREKLLQYASRVWNIIDGDDDTKIDAAIEQTEDFIKSLKIKTRLSDYNVKHGDIDKVIDGLKARGQTKLSERADLSLEICRQILELSM